MNGFLLCTVKPHALLFDRIVHSTLFLEEVVLGALCQTRRHSLIDRFVLIDRLCRFDRFLLITLLINFYVACVDELLTG